MESTEETTQEITTEAQTPEETSEEITEEETTTAEETEETEEEAATEEETEEASASLEDNVAEEPEGSLVAMSIHNVPRVSTSLEGMTEPAEETTEAAEEEEKQEPVTAEPTTAEPAVTEPSTAEPAAPEETTEAAEPTEEESEEGTIITIDEPETSAPEETEPTVENENQNVIPEDDKILSDDVLIEDEDAVAAYGSLKGGKVYGLVELDETYTARAFVISLDRLMEQTAPEEDALIPETPSALTPAEDTVIEAEVADGSISIRIEIPADLGITVDHAVAVPVDTEPFQELVEDSGDEGMQLQDMKAYDILLYDEEGNEIHKTIAADVKEDAVYTALWTPEEGIKYTVEYYYQTNGSYPAIADISDPRTGTTEDVVSVSDDDKDPKRNGYVFDTAANNVLSGTITGDGKLVLKVYFKQQFTVIYDPGDHGTFISQSTEHLDYNVQTPAFEGQITGEAGYTFDGWKPVIKETVKADAVYVAQWKAEDTEYKVEYYYQNEGKYADTTTESVTRTGKTGTLAEVKADDLKPVKNGYAFDSAAANVLEGTIKGDKSLVLKVYFKQQFTVVYDPGTHGTFTAETTKYLDYNVLTPEFKGSTTGDPGYTFVGWEPAIEKNVKADATYVAQWAANEDTRYKVEYYYQADGQYTDQADDTDVRTGTTDTLAETTSDDLKPTKDGYAFDTNAANVLTGNIEGNGSLVLKVYFKQQFTVTYKPGLHGIFTEQVTENLDYNAYTPDFIGVKEGVDGYTFERWEPAVETRVKEDAEYVAVWTANTDTKYTVEYYYQENGVYGAPEKYVVRRGTTDTEAVLESGDKISEKSDYVYDTAASNVESGNIAGDGSLVLKVYFKQQFTVTYQPGTHGTFTAQGHSGLSYGDATPGFSGEITGKDGYEFGGWTPAVTDTVTQNAVYVATWNAKGSTNYSVEFYYQNQGAYPAAANSVQKRSGMTDTTAAVTDADKTPAAGYILDTAASNVYEGIVAGNGSLVLRLYFKQQFTVTYEPGTNGTFATQITGGLSYNDKTPAFNGQTTGSGRYVFNGWSPVVAENVTGNAVYVAQWRYISSSSSGGGGGSSGGPNYNATGSSDGPGATVTVLPTEVPLANLPETDNGMTVIDDGEVPLAALPKTGNPSGTASWMLLLSSLLLAAYTMLGKKKEEEN